PVEGIIYPFVRGFTRPPQGCALFFEQIPRFVGSRQSNHIHAWASIGRTVETFCDSLLRPEASSPECKRIFFLLHCPCVVKIRKL
ncbi:hypothetical protein, partial [Caballeronia mineralivorans]|uniref:hypothetical protein n=1 Tax=Caballeronia mineralivorans TaxID=2010198 RepID=UPI0023F34BDE